MSTAAVRVLANGQVLVDTQHVDARTIVRALHAFSMIEAYRAFCALSATSHIVVGGGSQWVYEHADHHLFA